MAKKKYKHSENQDQGVNEQKAIYKRITFSTIETQNDVQLLHSIKLSHKDRLLAMRMLNDYVFKNYPKEKFTFKNSRINFSSYEYIPG